ncbi:MULTISPECIES: zf-HC2 domain-containing protein [Desulfitobacterium]|uniref:Putative zinc-finger domain-containing protein n=1 Tax=Desulfitobacterium dehalogenans (strain ATCC 51507 / DSM 9161 / JW/IU-DC1) TaxID=756499 RepID=I4A8Q2_DESDJ|nr:MULTISPECIES: zf-HC2 domain-containing protein [Desulfitobacterium]AFM00337.1 hypothetical protein Desde_1949 [Desulfitobacterium dehalogenans ATCC 51507]
MNKISCPVCLDLIPLVKDGIASEDSRLLVQEHLAGCEHCSDSWGEKTEADMGADTAMDDTVVLGKIKKQMMLFLLSIMLAGTLLGMVISNGMHMFYNGLIMPAIGGFGYMLFKRKAYFVPLGLFAFSFIWVFVRGLIDGILTYTGIIDLISMSAWWSAIFSAFSAVGVLIAWLLHYAFKKEV